MSVDILAPNSHSAVRSALPRNIFSQSGATAKKWIRGFSAPRSTEIIDAEVFGLAHPLSGSASDLVALKCTVDTWTLPARSWIWILLGFDGAKKHQCFPTVSCATFATKLTMSMALDQNRRYLPNLAIHRFSRGCIFVELWNKLLIGKQLLEMYFNFDLTCFSLI